MRNTNPCSDKLSHRLLEFAPLWTTASSNWLQKVQNIAARIISKQRKFDHITPVLKSLHWLRVEHRILFKLLMITVKAIHGIAPIYLSDLIRVNEQKRSLRQNNRMKVLSVPRFNTATYERKAFVNAAPTEWNKLPENIRTITEFWAFKRELKTFLFKVPYNC